MDSRDLCVVKKTQLTGIIAKSETWPCFSQVSILSAMELIWNLCEILFVEAAAGEQWTILMFRLKGFCLLIYLFKMYVASIVSYLNMF